MRILRMLALALLLLLLCGCAAAQQATDVSARCSYTSRGKKYSAARMLDRDYMTHSNLAKGQALDIVAQEPLSGVFIQLYKNCAPGTVQAKVGEEWRDAGSFGTYITQWIPLPEGTRELRVKNGPKEMMYIAEIRVYGQGDRPSMAAAWQDLDKADLMLMIAHPDDDLLWFGGFLPTYAGEKGYKVQVMYLTVTNPNRQLQLLDALWLCGIRYYPRNLGLPDKYSKSLKAQYQHWSKTAVYRKVTAAIRRYKPEVILTQDVAGEYGHGAHRVVADAVMNCSAEAADAARHPDSAKQYGTWQTKKVYIHLYGQNQIHMNWNKPLAHFGGKTGMEMAIAALNCHVSQVARGWSMDEARNHDNTLFGLYSTTVGPDVMKDDFMENIAGAAPAADSSDGAVTDDLSQFLIPDDELDLQDDEDSDRVS